MIIRYNLLSVSFSYKSFYSTMSAPILQPCSCQVPYEGYRNATCSCPQQQQQQSAFSPTPAYPQSHYPLVPVHHIQPGGVSFSPIPVASSLAISTMIPTIHGQPDLIPSRVEDSFFQRHPVRDLDESFYSPCLLCRSWLASAI